MKFVSSLEIKSYRFRHSTPSLSWVFYRLDGSEVTKQWCYRGKIVSQVCLRFTSFSSVSVCSPCTPAFPSSPLCCLSSRPPPLLSPEGPAVNFDLHKELVKCLCNPCVSVCECVFYSPCHVRVILRSLTQETSCLGPSHQPDWSHKPEALTHLPTSCS